MDSHTKKGGSRGGWRDLNNSRSQAFTLIELLVVVSIIALLISILLPSLQRAREQAKSTVCLSNLKQYGNAMSYYATDHPGSLPPYCISRRVNSSPSDSTNTPYWFQYLPLMYLSNNFNVSKCPADNLDDVARGGKRGPYRDLQTLKLVVYYSYAMNPNQPKRCTPVFLDTQEGRLAVAPQVVPYNAWGVVERFNPGKIDGLRRASEFAFLLETASTGLLNPDSELRLFRTNHGPKKDRMNLVFGDTHAEPKSIRDIWPGDFSQQPTVPGTKWSPKIRAFWFGDENATSARCY